jgi:hypothetical protein
MLVHGCWSALIASHDKESKRQLSVGADGGAFCNGDNNLYSALIFLE